MSAGQPSLEAIRDQTYGAELCEVISTVLAREIIALSGQVETNNEQLGQHDHRLDALEADREASA